MGSDLSDSGSVYPVKTLRASSDALRPAVTGQPLPPLNRRMALIAEQNTILLNRLQRVTQTSRTIQRNRLRLSQARQPSR